MLALFLRIMQNLKRAVKFVLIRAFPFLLSFVMYVVVSFPAC